MVLKIIAQGVSEFGIFPGPYFPKFALNTEIYKVKMYFHVHFFYTTDYFPFKFWRKKKNYSRLSLILDVIENSMY